MTILSLLIFISFCITLYLAAMVYYEDKKNLANQCFALACLSVAATALVEFMLTYMGSPEQALFWMRMKSVSFFTLPLLLHYILAYTNSKWLQSKITYLIIYLPAVFMVVNHYCFVQVDSARSIWGFGYHNRYFYLELFRYFWLSVESIALIYLCFSYSYKTTGKNKLQSRYMSYTILAALLLTIFIYAIAGVLKHPIPEFVTVITSIPLYFILIYLMNRYKLFVLNPTTAAPNIISTMTDAFLLVDPDGHIVNLNLAAQELLGYGEAELIGQPLKKILQDTTGRNELMPQAIRNNLGTSFETRFWTKQGSAIPVSLSTSLLKDNQGEAAGVVIIARDITRMILTEETLVLQSIDLARSNHDLNEFTYIVSHDLQEPLRKLITFGDRLKVKYKELLSGEGRDYLDRMQSAASRMQTLINDLLTYSRITTQAQPFLKVDLSQIMKEVLSDLKIRIEQTKSIIEFGKLPSIEADENQMRQLFQNLIGNALKFSTPGISPRVQISSSLLSTAGVDHYELTVADNGIGIERECLDKIFGVFQRAHGKDAYEGTGIGLAVCKKIVERHNGSIRVESEPGVGSKFIVRIPVTQ
ncbi:MAG TPA: ATP-binding protein [Bacillota bacterium]|nr:ATP-binding protein [Bacillota bacterium]